MSIMKCKNCCKDVDTDRTEMVVFLGKYHYCENCTDRDEIFEILDEMQTALDKTNKLYSGSVKALVNANIELRTIYDSAKQGMVACGIPL